MITTGLNGFGRIGLHLLKYWLDRAENANFEISFINDEVLTYKQAYDIIQNDKYVQFDQYQVIESPEEIFIIKAPSGKEYRIPYSTKPKDQIPWKGKIDIVLECSGRYAAKEKSKDYLEGKTKVVAVSATSWDADKTLIFGYNHEEFDPKRHQVISYGSCTVNAYVVLADYINKKYGVTDSDFSCIHNLPEYQLKNFNTLNRRFSTVQRSAAQLLPFLDEDKNFTVKYTIVPFAGVSMVDFRFRVKNPISKEGLFEDLEKATQQGELKGLYGIVEADHGPEEHNLTPYSAVIVKDTTRVLGDTYHIHGYMDNENSVNRYFDTVNHIASKLL